MNNNNYNIDPRNIEGLKNDIYCAIDHFRNYKKAKKYVLKDSLQLGYTKEEILKAFQEVKKDHINECIMYNISMRR